MLIFGIYMLVIGAFTYRKAGKLERRIAFEEDEKTKESLTYDFRRTKLNANVLIFLGLLVLLIILVFKSIFR